MNSSKLILCFLCFRFKVTQTEASSWTIEMPSSIEGLLGSCVVIPCSFNFPHSGNKALTKFTGMWIDVKHHLAYHPVESKILQQYQNRTLLLGDFRQKSCSLMIDPLEPKDEGPFHFRIEIAGYDNYTYKQKIFIKMISELHPIAFTLKEVIEGQTESASCSVSHTCPTSPPVFTWSLLGQTQFQSEQLEDGRWRATSVLYFHPTRADDNKALQCTVTYRGGMNQKAFKIIKVEYAPEIKAASSCSTKENMTECVCIVESKPPSTVHFVLFGKVLLNTKIEKLDSVTIGTIKAELGSYKFVLCVANNTQGNASLTLFLPNSKMLSLYVIITGAAVVVLMLLIAVGVVKICRRKSGAPSALHISNRSGNKDLELPPHTTKKRQRKSWEDVNCDSIYANYPAYGNIKIEWEDAIYSNIQSQ
ncbi:myelin-associated glycoprotein-like isoform X2 [Antennarius striatus]|uniref:myelin-associated glycoprotein-like isoform X2 n=1 Tax=Antennarius striatus TaxID=241820 RepID=UPI0035B1BF90